MSTIKPRYIYVAGRPGVDGGMARLAEVLLEDVQGAGTFDVIKLAEEFQLAYEEACQEVEARVHRAESESLKE